jgi:hypothetical protein
MGAARSRAAGEAGTGQYASEPPDGRPHPALPGARGVPDDFDRLLDGWLAGPDGGRTTVRLVCGNGVVLTVTDQAVVEHMLWSEIERRKVRETGP